MVHLLAPIMGMVAALSAASPATAQHLFEPEVGFKFFDGKISDLIGPGLEFGGTYGRVVSNSAAVTLHADLGFHSTRIHGD